MLRQYSRQQGPVDSQTHKDTGSSVSMASLDRWHEEIHHLLPLDFALFLIITSEVSQLTLKDFCIVLLILCGKQVYTN